MDAVVIERSSSSSGSLAGEGCGPGGGVVVVMLGAWADTQDRRHEEEEEAEELQAATTGGGGGGGGGRGRGSTSRCGVRAVVGTWSTPDSPSGGDWFIHHIEDSIVQQQQAQQQQQQQQRGKSQRERGPYYYNDRPPGKDTEGEGRARDGRAVTSSSSAAVGGACPGCVDVASKATAEGRTLEVVVAVDYIATEDYLFRWDVGAFWMGRCMPRTFVRCVPIDRQTQRLTDCGPDRRSAETAVLEARWNCRAYSTTVCTLKNSHVVVIPLTRKIRIDFSNSFTPPPSRVVRHLTAEPTTAHTYILYTSTSTSTTVTSSRRFRRCCSRPLRTAPLYRLLHAHNTKGELADRVTTLVRI